MRFKHLVILDRGYTLHTIRYSYDSLARLREARYAPGINANAPDADLLRRYQYAFDLSGNRTQQIATIAGSATTNYGYNAANQMTSAGAATLTYDNNGNLINDGTTAYTWDRANRMLSAGGTNYGYEGMGNRIKQTVGANVTQYLLDLQPGLAVVLSQTTGVNTDRYVHAPRGIHAQKDAGNNWEWMLQDGLGSVCGVADNGSGMLWSGSYDPFGNGFSATGTSQTSFGFTGEQYDVTTDLLYLRARHYKPGLGQFTALDPFEGTAQRVMSLNGYSWVEGNVSNAVDPSGKCLYRNLTDLQNGTQASQQEIDTCKSNVSVLQSRYGITLTQEDNLEFDTVWTISQVANFFQASTIINERYSASGLAFSDVFGGTSMTLRQGGSTSYCGSTPSTDNISWYPCSGFNDPYSVDNIIHELGHILQNRAGNIDGKSMAEMWDLAERRSGLGSQISGNSGLGFENPDFRQNARAQQLNPGDRLFEEISDMYLFWVRGYPFSIRALPGSAERRVGTLRRQFTVGGTYLFAEANGGPYDFPSIIDWSRLAAGISSSYTPAAMPVLLRDTCEEMFMV